MKYILRPISFHIADFDNSNFYELNLPRYIKAQYEVDDMMSFLKLIREELCLEGRGCGIEPTKNEGEFILSWYEPARYCDELIEMRHTIKWERYIKG